MLPRFSLPSVLVALTVFGCSSSSDSSDGDGSSVPTTPIDRSSYTDVGLTGALDYSDPNLWVCRPGNEPNECYTNLDATMFMADGTSMVEKHEDAKNPKFDCFYVYPTVDLVGTHNTTDFSDISHVQDALLTQGARFSQMCEVYAPLYRQSAIGTSNSGTSVGLNGDAALAYGDVEAAFKYYMANLNKGRKFVLIGHSQGTFMLTQLYTTLFENDAGLRSQLISALLIGGSITVPSGQKVGGTFKTLPACSAPGETGCVIAYNSFAVEAPPPANSLFGKAAAGSEVVCTPPGPLANNTGRSKMVYQPKVINTAVFIPNEPPGSMPPFDTPYAGFPDVFRGACVAKHAVGDTEDAPLLHYMEVSLDPPAGDKRTVGPYRNTATEGLGFGLHVVDYNLFMGDLLEAVRLQAEAALK